jgi:hypothetical protein
MPAGSPLAAVAQLWRRDVSLLPAPGGAVVLQVLWCAAEHHFAYEGGYDYIGPSVQLRWWNSFDLDDRVVGVAQGKSFRDAER